MRLGMFALAMAASAPMAAHAADAPCAAVAPPPIEFQGWAHRRPVLAGRRAGGDATPELALEQAADVALSPAGKVAFASPLAKPAAPGDMAGLLVFRAPLAGTYHVALGAAAWVDVVQAGAALASVAHAHGPECSGIRKTVDFRLAAGRYILQFSGAGVATLPVMIVQLP
jgi:hypothetical protein